MKTKLGETMKRGVGRPTIMVLLAAGVLALGIAGAPSPAHAVGNLKLGPFAVHPYADLGVEYSDNVTRVADHELSDTYFDLRPGIYLETPRDDRKLRFLYEMRIEEYADNDQYVCRFGDTSIKCSQNAVNHRAEALARFKLSSGILLEAGYSYQFTHDDRGSNLLIRGGITPGTGTLEVDPRLSFFDDNTIRAGIGYEFADRYRIKVDGAYQQVDYSRVQDEFRDHDATSIGGTFYYRFMPKTNALIEIRRIDTDYDHAAAKDLDGDEMHYLLGITWAYEDKSSGTVKAGYGKKNFDTADQPDFDGFIFSISVDHHFSSWTSLAIEGVRQINETNFIPANYTDTTTLNAELAHKFTGKIGVTGKVGYLREDYSIGYQKIIEDVLATKDFTDETWTLGIDLSYDMRDWLGFKLGYEYRTRSSDFEDLEYDENRLLFRIIATL